MRHLIFSFFLLHLAACSSSTNSDQPGDNCNQDLKATHSITEVKALYQGDLYQIQEDWIIEGYVISTDRAGNFFSELYLQENPSEVGQAIKINIDLRDSHLWFPLGRKVMIRLKGLYLGKSKDVFELGGTFAGFGTLSVGRLPALKIPDHLLLSCDTPVAQMPLEISLNDLKPEFTHHLVKIQELEIESQDRDSTYAQALEETERTLVDCEGNSILLRNSGFADFQEAPLPKGRGSVTGVLLREREDYFLKIRDTTDVNFSLANCSSLLQTSRQVFISELADPDNNSDARFVEIYNADSKAVNLNGWQLERYTNANVEIGSVTDLAGFWIQPESTLILANNSEEFTRVYGFAPDIEAGANSVADSNGDDNIILRDPFGEVIDIFGRIGEDGTGTDHEFEDGRALRKPDINQANVQFTTEEWIICNDSGGEGTTNMPKNAPEDFSPGIRN